MNISKIAYIILLTGMSSTVNANDNISAIDQVGGTTDIMDADIEQSGNNTNNTSYVKQTGSDKSVLVHQRGDGNENSSTIFQAFPASLFDSTGSIFQYGSNNINNSFAWVTKQGYFSVYQRGKSNINTSSIFQGGDGILSSIYALIGQEGNSTVNDAYVTQGGEDSETNIYQSGNNNHNTSTVNQLSSGNSKIGVRQMGDNNTNNLAVIQRGKGDLFVDQLGISNINAANIYQSGIDEGLGFDPKESHLTQQGVDTINTAVILINDATRVNVTQQGTGNDNRSFADASAGAQVVVLQAGNNESNNSSVTTHGGVAVVNQQ